MKVQLMSLVGMFFLPCFGLELHACKREAEARIVYRVIDDEGMPVSNALAHVWFRSDYPRIAITDWISSTDSNGEFVAECKTNERVSIGIDKEGYYHAFDRVTFRSSMGRYNVVGGKWHPYGETRTIELKRMRQPHEMLGPDCPPQRKIRIYDEWLGFDLENGDFLPPMGNGRNTDMLVRFVLKGQMPYDWSINMEVSFTNYPFAGAYRMRKDDWSDMKSVYFADTNAVYLTNFSFRYAREKGVRRPIVEKLGADEYIVFRTRTKVDRDGNLMSARYGKLYGPWHFEDAGGSQIQKVFLNKADNDVNLEDAWTIENAKKYRR